MKKHTRIAIVLGFLFAAAAALGYARLDTGGARMTASAQKFLGTLSDAELEILPTVTDLDRTPAARPWLENIEGKKNIPETTSVPPGRSRPFSGGRGCRSRR